MKNKRYRYYQPNGKDLKDEQGDCSIRALTKFNDSTWVEEFDNLVKYARETQKMLDSLSNIELYMQDNNIPYTSVYKPKARHKITVDEFAKDHKSGKYIIYCRVGYGTHLVAIDNGVYYDTWDCGDRIIYGYWTK